MTDLRRDLRKVLILTEDHGHIELTLPSKANKVKSEPQVDSLLLLGVDDVTGTVRQTDLSGPVAYGTRRYVNTGTPHAQEAALPVPVPLRVPVGGGDTSIEPHPMTSPSVRVAHGLAKRVWVVVRVLVSERGLGVPEEILAVKERDDALCGGLWRHVRAKK